MGEGIIIVAFPFKIFSVASSSGRLLYAVDDVNYVSIKTSLSTLEGFPRRDVTGEFPRVRDVSRSMEKSVKSVR